MLTRPKISTAKFTPHTKPSENLIISPLLKRYLERKTELRKKTITVRTFESYCKFMTKHELSPSKVFNTAIAELIEKTK